MKLLTRLAIAGVVGLLTTAALGTFSGDDEPAEQRVHEYTTGSSASEYVSADGRFRATFPGMPGRETEKLDAGGRAISVTTFLKELGDAAFGVSVIEVGQDEPFDLDVGVNGAAAGVEGRVEASTRVQVLGLDGIEFVIAAPDGAFVKGLFVRASDRVYQVTVVGKENPPAGYDTFKASFQITP